MAAAGINPIIPNKSTRKLFRPKYRLLQSSISLLSSKLIRVSLSSNSSSAFFIWSFKKLKSSIRWVNRFVRHDPRILCEFFEFFRNMKEERFFFLPHLMLSSIWSAEGRVESLKILFRFNFLLYEKCFNWFSTLWIDFVSFHFISADSWKVFSPLSVDMNYI